MADVCFRTGKKDKPRGGGHEPVYVLYVLYMEEREYYSERAYCCLEWVIASFMQGLCRDYAGRADCYTDGHMDAPREGVMI